MDAREPIAAVTYPRTALLSSPFSFSHISCPHTQLAVCRKEDWNEQSKCNVSKYWYLHEKGKVRQMIKLPLFFLVEFQDQSLLHNRGQATQCPASGLNTPTPTHHEYMNS